MNVVITGSTKGIGFGLAQEFLKRGHNVVVSGRSSDAVDHAVKRLERDAKQSAQVLCHPCDVTSYQDVEALWAQAAARFGRIDIWINNAGLAKTTNTIAETSVSDVQQMVSTNMLGTIFGSKVALSGMTKQGGGQIFNMLGGGSHGKSRPGMGVYGATKRGLRQFTESLERETAHGPVRVGQVKPGMVMTEGVLREAEAAGPAEMDKSRRVMNILFDHVETVAPYLVEKMLSNQKHAARISWMTGSKIMLRFATSMFSKRDVLSRYRV